MPREYAVIMSRLLNAPLRPAPDFLRCLEPSGSAGSSVLTSSGALERSGQESSALADALRKSFKDRELLREFDFLLHSGKTSTKLEVKRLFVDLNSKESEDCRSLVQGLELSLICPLTRTRITHAAKFYECEHIQCFDALSFMKTYKTSYVLKCPVCGKKKYSTTGLMLNDFVQEILNDPKTANVSTVTLRKDGTWKVQPNTQRDSALKSSTLRRTDSKRGKEPRKQLVDVESNKTIFLEGDEDSDSDVEILDITSKLGRLNTHA